MRWKLDGKYIKKLFKNLLKNRWAYFNQTSHTSLGEQDFKDRASH